VTDLLCHSTQVSDSFYALDPDEEGARRVRAIILGSGVPPSSSPELTSCSEDEGKVS